MAIDRSIEHNNRTGFGSLCRGGLRCHRLRVCSRLLRRGRLRGKQRRSRAAEHGADQKQRAGSPAKTRRP